MFHALYLTALRSYNLGQNKWNIWTTPPPISVMPKWRVFAPSRLHHCFWREGEGDNCSILKKGVVQQNPTRQCQKVLWAIAFPGPWLRFKVFQRHRGKKHEQIYLCLLFSCWLTPRTSLNQRQTLSTHNTNRHCRVRFYAFLGQTLSKQLYTRPINCWMGW